MLKVHVAHRLAAVAALAIAAVCAQQPCNDAAWFTATRTGNKPDTEACLMQSPSILDAQDELGCTALVNAAANSHTEMCQYLVQEGANVNGQCRSGNTALVYAARHGNLDLVKFLRGRGADIDVELGPMHTGNTALEEAASQGHFDVVKFLHSLEVSLQESWSGTELMWAAANDQADMIKAHTNNGADLAVQDDHGNTALHWAAKQGAVKAIHVLASAGSDVHAKTHSGWTPLILAAYHGHTEAVKALQIAGANIDETDKIGWPAATWAAAQGQLEVLSILKSAGADLGIAGAGWSPLMVATAEGHVATAKFLLRRGVSWQAANNQGQTCKSVACAKDADSELCELFTNMQRVHDEHDAREQHTEL